MVFGMDRVSGKRLTCLEMVSSQNFVQRKVIMLEGKSYQGWKWHVEDFVWNRGHYRETVPKIETRLNEISDKACYLQLSESGNGFTLVWAENKDLDRKRKY